MSDQGPTETAELMSLYILEFSAPTKETARRATMAISTTSSPYSTIEAPLSLFSHCLNLLMYISLSTRVSRIFRN